MKNIDVDDVFINESTEGNPNITSYIKKYDNEKIEYMFGSNSIVKKIINVPDGTIDKDFNVDLNDN